MTTALLLLVTTCLAGTDGPVTETINRLAEALSLDRVAKEHREVSFEDLTALSGPISQHVPVQACGHPDVLFVLPDMAAFHITTLALTMVILGGAGSVSGVILGAMLIIGYDQIIVPKLAAFIAALSPPDALFIGSSPDIRGTSFFNFGLALYLTVLWRGRRREKE